MNKELKLGLTLGAVASILLSWGIHEWQVTKIELALEKHANEEIEKARDESKRLLKEASAKDAKHQSEVAALNGRYQQLDAQLDRMRVENAKLKRSNSASTASQRDCRVQERDDLLLRMAELGLRTSRAVEGKQAALKNCVGNYGNLTTR